MPEKIENYQLCRMALVNAGTNMHVPSGRITAIDPRGGASVLGENGVGKTTTLRILVLFFGHLPSQLVASGGGQEGMIRFVLPSDASAIAYEYQRGSGKEEDLRLAVIRRRADDPDVPFYRLYRCGFRKELFVDEGRFLTDEETQKKATELGILTTSKLSTSDYRSVILRTPATSRDREKLRRYAIDWSFGPKQLDNMDRLVAAMVKKHINFSDIVQVAVGLVQYDLGQGAERAKLKFKQGREPIERWLRNREACEKVFKLAPVFDELDGDLQKHRRAEADFRARRADVRALTRYRKDDAKDVGLAQQRLEADREVALEAEKANRVQLTRAASEASEKAAQVSTEYHEASQQAQRFETEEARKWADLVQELPRLKGRAQSVESQIEAAESTQAQAAQKYQKLKIETQSRADEQRFHLEKGKERHRKRLDEAKGQIAQSEQMEVNACEEGVAARRESLDGELDLLQEQRGATDAICRNPAAPEPALREAAEARQRLEIQQGRIGEAQATLGNAKHELQEATHAFEKQEEAVRKSRLDRDTGKTRLDEMRARFDPTPGTLLAALRAHPDDGWKRNLAKVIDPGLLARDDLDANFMEGADQAIYGWQVNTGVIATPEWTDDAMMREAVQAAQERLGTAESAVRQQEDDLARCGERRDGAQRRVHECEASLSVLNNQLVELRAQRDAAELKVNAEIHKIRDDAARELARQDAAISSLKAQRKTADAERTAALRGIKDRYDQQRKDATSLYEDAILGVDTEIGRLQQELKVALQSLDDQLNAHLSAAGVDVQRLDGLREDLRMQQQDIREREQRQALVEAWHQWVEDGGPARVEQLKSAATAATGQARACTAKLSEFEQLVARSASKYTADAGAMANRIKDIDNELEILKQLDEQFGDYLPSGESAIDRKTLARELRAKVDTMKNDLDVLEVGIRRRTSNLRQALTAKDSSVKDFIEASLAQNEGADVAARAQAFLICYRQLGRQVVNDVNLTLRTLLANIGAFHKSLQSFEREVSLFNRRLQEGLAEVRCFERIRDLRLDIVTNFENLGFYKKLARMEAVVRQHANEVGKDYTRELPPEETARALQDFLSVLGNDGGVEVSLAQHITLKGSVSDNGLYKEFRRASELEGISSEGLTSLILITLMIALLNTIRRSEPVYVPWVTDEVGKFDSRNFRALMQMLRNNRIDVVTAAPELGPTQQAMFAQRYLFEDRGRIREYRPLILSSELPSSTGEEPS